MEPDGIEAARIAETLGTLALAHGASDMPWIRVEPMRLATAAARLRDDPSLGFDVLTDLTAADRMGFPEPSPERFCVVIHLYSLSRGARLRLHAFVPEKDPAAATLSGLWGNADWLERECFDMFGIRFAGHPDLRRILMPEGYEGHPLRRDYPLRGRGERDRFETTARGTPA